MRKKEKDIFEEIGEKLREVGEELKTEFVKAERKLRDFDKAIEPSLDALRN